MSDKIICPLSLADSTKPMNYCKPGCAWRVRAIDGVNTFPMCAITALATAHADVIAPTDYGQREE